MPVQATDFSRNLALFVPPEPYRNKAKPYRAAQRPAPHIAGVEKAGLARRAQGRARPSDPSREREHRTRGELQLGTPRRKWAGPGQDHGGHVQGHRASGCQVQARVQASICTRLNPMTPGLLKVKGSACGATRSRSPLLLLSTFKTFWESRIGLENAEKNGGATG